MNKLTRGVYLTAATCMAVLVMTGCSAKAKLDRHLKSADKYFDAGQYPRAEVEYKNVLQFNSLHPRALARLGSIYYDQGRSGLAYFCLTKAGEQAPNDLDVRVKLGNINLAGGKTREARAEANFVLEKMPGNAEALVLLVESVTNKTDAEAIRQRLEKLTTQLGETAATQLAFGSLCAREGDLKAAETAFKRAQTLDPKSSAAHFAVGNLLLAQKDVAGADAALKTAADLAPVRSIRRLQYAMFKIATGDTEKGKQLLGQITKEAPDYLPAWRRQADIAFAEKKYEDCDSLLEQILARDANDLEALLLRGRLMLARRESSRAVVELERISSLYPVPQVYLLLAQAHLQANDATAALKNIDQALAKVLAMAKETGGNAYGDPTFLEALLLQARINMSRNETGLAIAALTDLIKEQPKLPQAYLGLATAYRISGKLEEALMIYRRMEELNPKDPQPPLLMGMVYEQQNKKEEARRAFAKTHELAPDYLPAVEHLVNLDVSEGQVAAALARVQKEAGKNPKSAEVQLLLAKVYAAQPDAERMEAALLKAIELDPNLEGPHSLLAQYYKQTGKNVKAVEKLKAGLQMNPRDAGALMLMATIQSEMKDFSGARTSYEKLLEVNPNSYLALNNLAYLYSEKLGELDKAVELARKARELLTYQEEPGLGEASAAERRNMMESLRASATDTLGWALYRKREYARALPFLQESATKLSTEPEVLYHLGMASYMAGQEAEAKIALNRALTSTNDFPGRDEISKRLEVLAIDPQAADPKLKASLEKQFAAQPEDPVILSRLLAIYEREKTPEKSIGAYEAVLKQNPKNLQALLKLATLYAGSQGTSKRALELANEAYKLAPEDPDASCILGRLVFKEDQKRAVGLLEKSAAIRTEDRELLYDLAVAYYSVGRIPESEATMRTVLRLTGAFSRAAEAGRFLEMAPSSTSPQKALEAEGRAKEILKVSPDDVPAAMVVALCLRQHGQSDAARQAFEKLRVKYPDFSPATKQLAALQLELGEDQKAYDMAIKARQAYPEDPEVAQTLGITLFRRKDYRNSARLLAESQKGKPDATASYYEGLARLELKEKKEGKEALERALALNVQPKLADEARRRLATLN